MSHPPLAYRTLARMAVPVVSSVLRDPRQRAAHRARLAAPAAMQRWAAAHRDRSRRLAWFHAPSVGEGLQARAVIEEFRTLRPEWQIVYTHYSPSAEVFAGTIGADWHGYLPYDRASDVAAALDALSPDLLVFTKLDLWPELATCAAARGVRVTMVAATVNAGSSRLRWPARTLTAAGYRALAAVGTIAPEDGTAMVRLGCDAGRITVTGDPRIDSALGVVAATATDDPLLHLREPATTLVAGSTWPADEAVLLAAFARVRRNHPDARLVVAPHDPSAVHLDQLDAAARQFGVPVPVRLGSATAADDPPVLLIDRVGVLARVYANGAVAYVGGGFGRHGVHSVLEPVAWGRPVIVGPQDRAMRDIRLLAGAGGLIRLEASDPAAELAAQWASWLEEPELATRAGLAARRALDGDLGAALRTAELLDELVNAA